LFDKIDAESWDKAVADLRAQIPTLQAHEIKVGFSRIVSLFEYGHTQILFSTVASEGTLPVNLYDFEDGIFVEGVQKGDEKALGAKVLKIGDMAIAEAIKAVRVVAPVENDFYFKAYGLRFLTVPEILHAQGVIPQMSKTVTMTLEKEGSVFEHTFSSVPPDAMSRNYGYTIPNDKWVSARDQKTTPLYLKKLEERLYFFEYLADKKTLYVRQSSVFNDDKESLQDFYKRLFAFIDENKVEKMVYDVRLNGGGNNYNNKALIKGIMARPKINKKGNFFYIIGRNTFSAAQNLTNEIENYTEAIMVGEPTGENKNFYGDNRKLTLPHSKLDAYLSFAWWQDMPAWENKEYTIPHVAASMTFDEYRANQDPVLEAALDYTEKGFILNPMNHLTNLFTTGNLKQLEIDALKIAKDKAYKYSNFEEEFAAAAYRLFSQGDTKSGLYIMELNTKAFPESAAVWYSLASSLEQEQEVEKAKMAYKKIIELNSNVTLVKTAKNRLLKLEQ